MKKPFRLVVAGTCTMLPLAVVAPPSAQAAPAGPRETVTLKVSHDCVATVTGRWWREPTAPDQPILGVTDTTTTNYNEAGAPGPFRTTDSLTLSWPMDHTDTPHLLYAELDGVGTPGYITTSEQSVYCAVRYQAP